VVNEALAALQGDFPALYSPIGRRSTALEKLLRAMLLQAFYLIRSERLSMERLEYNLLFRWFVGIGVDDSGWDHSVFSKNRDLLLQGDMAAKFLGATLAQPEVKKLLSTDHFSVDSTLIEAWASMKSVKPKDGSGAPPGARRRSQRRSELPWPEAIERHAWLDHRSGCAALPQKARQGDQAVLHRAWADVEPLRPAGRCLPDAGRRTCRTGGGVAHARALAPTGRRRSRSAATRPTTRRTSSMNCVG
jgi:transposase